MRKLLAAPHRTGFFMGSVAMLASFAWWAWLMLQRANGHVVVSAFPAAWLHADLMLFGFLPLFMLGFINTAGPKWLGVDAPTRQHWIGSTLIYALGSLLGVLASAVPSLQSAGDALHVVGWVWAVAIWVGRIRQSQSHDRRHARVILLAFSFGLLAMLLQLLASLRLSPVATPALVQAAINTGLWGFLLPVFLTVSHRMIPFFSSSVLQPYLAWRPFWLLYTWMGLSLLHGVLATLAWFTPYANTALPDIVFAALLLWTSYRWQITRSFRVPLLAMLHASFAWAGIALTLFAAQAGLALFGVYSAGLAPLHALTIGFFCTMLLAFVTRVSLGHSGRPLVTGSLTWYLYWLVHAAAIARIAPEFIPAHASTLFSIAAMLILGGFALWAGRYVPMYWRDRADGKPG